METKLIQSFIAGIVATAVMSFIMYAAPLMGVPKMSSPEMLAEMVSMSIAAGWLMHFTIGIVFAAFYVFLFSPIITIKGKLSKGAAFGFLVFVFAQIAMALISTVIRAIPESKETLLAIVLGSIMGHVVFGIFVALAVKD